VKYSLTQIPILAIAIGIYSMPASIAAPRHTCDVDAEIIDPDPTGANIRDRPTGDSTVIGKLSRASTAKPFQGGVRILAVDGKWIYIQPDRDTNSFRQPGWINGKLLGVYTKGINKSTNPVPLFKTADPKSDLVGTIPPNREVKILDCNADWLFVEEQGVRGWLEYRYH
jgi:SH3-like domain-containing protein